MPAASTRVVVYRVRRANLAYHLPFMTVRTFAGTAAAFLAVALVCLTVAGWLGRIWWVFDIASSFRVQYAVLLLPVALVSLLLHQRLLAAVSLVALVANIAMILPLYTSKPAAPDGNGRLEVVSFNMNFANEQLDSVLESVRDSGADVVFLHEGTRVIERAVEAADLPYRAMSARRSGEKFGTIALLRVDADAQIVDFQVPGIAVTVPLGDRNVEVLGIHPLSPVSRERSAERDEELNAVAAWATAQQLPVVVTGDFNVSTWSRGFSLISRQLVNSQFGFGVQASWPVGFRALSVPIDHLLHSPDLTVVDRHLGPSLGSDHFPLFVTLAWASK